MKLGQKGLGEGQKGTSGKVEVGGGGWRWVEGLPCGGYISYLMVSIKVETKL